MGGRDGLIVVAGRGDRRAQRKLGTNYPDLQDRTRDLTWLCRVISWTPGDGPLGECAVVVPDFPPAVLVNLILRIL